MMPGDSQQNNFKPVIFLAFANDKTDNEYLQKLTAESRGIKEALENAEDQELCKIVETPATSFDDIRRTFQKHRDRIAIFHYGGHANGYQLLLETWKGEKSLAGSEGLVSFFAQQKGLQLIFLNGCSTRQQGLDLIEAGIPAVISTSRKISDEVAFKLAVCFYEGLASGATIERAWSEAEAQLKSLSQGISAGDVAGHRMLFGAEIEQIDDRFPWEIRYNEGKQELAKDWNLPEQVRNPLFGLPEIPEEYSLPPSPFLFLNRYEEKHAKIFFGRSYDIRVLYDKISNPKSPQVILLYGQSGVGKSSLFDAGLKPRLAQEYGVIYVRRIQEKGLAGTLQFALEERFREDCKTRDAQPAPSAVKTPVAASEIPADREALERLEAVVQDIKESRIRQEVEALINRFKNSASEDGGKELSTEKQDENGRAPHNQAGLDSLNANLSLLEKWKAIETAAESYRLTKHALNKLKLEGIPEEILKKLKSLENRPMRGESNFIKILTDLLGKKATATYQSLIITHALKPLIVILDQVEEMFTRPPESFEITEATLENLKSEKLPSNLLKRLEPLKDLRISGKHEFLECLEKEIGSEQVGPYKAKILKQAGLYDEFEALLALLLTIFGTSSLSPAGKLIMGYRKEYHPEIEKGFINYGLRHSKLFLDHLDRGDLLDIFRGLTQTRELNEEYHLSMEENLPEIVADDLLEDKDSPVAPALQIVLTKLWKIEKEEKDSHKPRFTIGQYQELKKKGIAMGEFFQQQMELLAERQPAVVKSGLALDVLFFHTTSMGTAAICSKEELEKRYLPPASKDQSAVQDGGFQQLIQNLQELSLLTSTQYSKQSTGLAHDTLAPVVIREYTKSDLPGQRAARILAGKINYFRKNKKGIWLDRVDLEAVEKGMVGMRRLSDDERELLTVSRKKRRNNRIYRYGSLAAIILFAIIAAVLGQVSRHNYLKARANNLAFIANEVLKTDNTKALRIAGEAYRVSGENSPPAVQQILSDVFHTQDQALFYSASLPHRKQVVYSAVFSPDGERILTASEDEIAMLWNTRGELIDTLKHKDEVSKAAFSRKGRILTFSPDNTVRIWFSRDSVKLLKHDHEVYFAEFSPDGRVLTGLADSSLILCDEEGRAIDTLHYETELIRALFADDNSFLTVLADSTVILCNPRGEPVDTLNPGQETLFAAFSRDGRILTALRDSSIIIWNKDGEPLDTLRYKDDIDGAEFSRDGKILTFSPYSTVRIWDDAGNLVDSIEHDQDINAAIFSPDGNLILITPKDSVALLRDGAGKLLGRLKHKKEIRKTAFSTDGQRILTASEDGTAKLWDLSQKITHHIAEHSGQVYSAVFSSDGKYILTASWDKSAGLWDQQGNLVRSFPHDGKVTSAVFSPDGKQILTASADTAKLWLVANRTQVNTFPHGGEVKSAVFSPNGNRVLTTSDDYSARLWRADNGAPIDTFYHRDELNTAIFSSGGTQILSASMDSTAILWSAEGTPIDTFHHKGPVYMAVFSPRDSSRILTAAADSTARLWKAKGNSFKTLPHESEVNLAIFSPDGGHVLTAADDGIVKLWDKDGSLIDSLSQKLGITSAVFSPDGKLILTASKDRTAKLWNLKGEQLANLDKHNDIVGTVAFSSDGKRMLSASNDGSVLLWWTPRAIFEWLQTANIYQLTIAEKKEFGIIE